jgi:hypothetical protein
LNALLVAAAAAAAGAEATRRAFTVSRGVFFAGARTRVALELHVGPRELLALVGCHRGAATKQGAANEQAQHEHARQKSSPLIPKLHRRARYPRCVRTASEPLFAGKFAPRFPDVVCAVICSKRVRPWLWLSLILGCGAGPYDLPPPTPDGQQFAQQVYPVLLRDCGFAACHGDHRRFFHIFGPGRVRLVPTMDPFDPATNEEIQLSYDRARSMLRVNALDQSLLLRKPLEPIAGGVGHRGLDELGRNVYLDANAPNLVLLRNWATETMAAPVPPGATP